MATSESMRVITTVERTIRTSAGSGYITTIGRRRAWSSGRCSLVLMWIVATTIRPVCLMKSEVEGAAEVSDAVAVEKKVARHSVTESLLRKYQGSIALDTPRVNR